MLKNKAKSVLLKIKKLSFIIVEFNLIYRHLYSFVWLESVTSEEAESWKQSKSEQWLEVMGPIEKTLNLPVEQWGGY